MKEHSVSECLRPPASGICGSYLISAMLYGS